MDEKFSLKDFIGETFVMSVFVIGLLTILATAVLSVKHLYDKYSYKHTASHDYSWARPKYKEDGVVQLVTTCYKHKNDGYWSNVANKYVDAEQVETCFEDVALYNEGFPPEANGRMVKQTINGKVIYDANKDKGVVYFHNNRVECAGVKCDN